MSGQFLTSITGLAVVIATVSLAPVSVAGQAAKTEKALRTPWGDPDLSGHWATPSSVATPLERPAALAGKATLTDEEVAQRVEQVRTRRDTSGIASPTNPRPDPVGNYNDFWTPEEARMSNRTSLIVDPADGRVPPLTGVAQKRATERAEARRGRGPADSWEDLGLWSRCITRNSAPMIPGPYANNYQIVQSPGWIAIKAEVIDTRIIPLDGRPHAGPDIRQWLGDSRGRWEGDTLVIETTNFSNKINFRGSSERLRLIERFTRTDASTLKYEFTVEDPTTFTRPWTALNPMTTLDGRIYEYACHEGNYSMIASLSGARAEEKAAAAKAAAEGR